MAEDEALTAQWMFQYNPEWYDLEASIKQRLTEDWTMYRHRDYVRVGQRIYFMRSGGYAGGDNAAITAVGRIATPIYEKPEETERHLRYWVDVVYDALVVPSITRPEMREEEAFQNYSPYVKGIFHSAFRLPPDVARRTEQLVRNHLKPIGTSSEGVERRIFVSHSHADDEFGVRLVHDLRKALGGHDDAVWYDSSGGLHGGDVWWREIVANIKSHPVFVVIVSPDSMKSPWVNDEIDLAWKLKNAPGGKLIVPVVYRNCEMREDLSLRQAVSFLAPRPYQGALQELLSIINRAK